MDFIQKFETCSPLNSGPGVTLDSSLLLEYMKKNGIKEVKLSVVNMWDKSKSISKSLTAPQEFISCPGDLFIGKGCYKVSLTTNYDNKDILLDEQLFNAEEPAEIKIRKININCIENKDKSKQEEKSEMIYVSITSDINLSKNDLGYILPNSSRFLIYTMPFDMKKDETYFAKIPKAAVFVLYNDPDPKTLKYNINITH